MTLPWLSFLSAWGKHDDRDKIQHVMDRASAAVTRLVFGRWNRIFGEDTRGKEVVISFEVIEGETEDTKGAKTKTQDHDVQIKFQIRDGTRRFNVNDRSLGFRWFFAFMLFTQFRVARSKTRPLLFLFDEPASNLHAAAQQKLIDCFPEIARDDHTLAYTTHSHYMIEPKWLEQTFIVTNRADDPQASILDEISLDDESLDIKVATYRSFVNEHPNQTSYFQPILDRLQVAPSRFDMRQASVVVEGRSDYYILRYASKLLGHSDLPLLPGLGAGTFGALAALNVGWNLNLLFLLDGDKQGLEERERYIKEFGMKPDRVVTIDGILASAKTIEDLLDSDALGRIQAALQLIEKPSKGQIKRFFQERLAISNVEDLGTAFRERASSLLAALSNKLVA
jgi:AAA ATPase domain